MGLLTVTESEEVLDDDFDNTGAMLFFQTDTEIQILSATGFVEQKIERVN
jgi:hypothetical protein